MTYEQNEPELIRVELPQLGLGSFFRRAQISARVWLVFSYERSFMRVEPQADPEPRGFFTVLPPNMVIWVQCWCIVIWL